MVTDKDIKHLEPPQSGDAEQAVLGAILKDPDALDLVMPILATEDCFYSPRHRVIFRAMVELYTTKNPTDITTVANYLIGCELLEKAGGRAYLVDLAESVASTAFVETHAKIVKDKSLLRRLIDTSNETARSAYVTEQPAEELIAAAEAGLFRLTDQRDSQKLSFAGDLVERLANDVLTFQPGQQGKWLETRIHQLNQKITGFFYGDLVIVAGSPSQGKTSFAMDFCLYNSNFKKKSLYVSIDQTKESFGLRLLSARTGYSKTEMFTGRLTEAQKDLIAREAAKLALNQDIMIVDSPAVTALDIRSMARRIQRTYGLDILVVDYIQQIPGHRRFENRNLELTEISRILKETTKELNIVTVVLSQLNRGDRDRRAFDVEKKQWPFPNMSMLRESGALEQDANVVIFPWVPVEFLRSQWGDQSQQFIDTMRQFPWLEHLAYVIVDKNKDGDKGVIECRRDKQRMMFYTEAPSRKGPEEYLKDYQENFI